MKKVDIGIIGGTGVYDSSVMKDQEEVELKTPFGSPSGRITIGTFEGKRIAFLPRHGKKHSFPPHKVPYRANIWAMKELGVKRIIAASAVGSLNENLEPGSIVIPDQFIDFSKKRDYSFYDDEAVHVSLADPFCKNLAAIIEKSAEKIGIRIKNKGTYISIEGPRFSTRAESLFFKDIMKGDIIGMTLVPEAILAREAEICYITIATVTDYDVWETKPVSAEMVATSMKNSSEQVRKLISELIKDIPEPEMRSCLCKDALKDARL